MRNNDHIYELHLICGQDQYDGDTDAARRHGSVPELAVSTFGENEKPTAIDTSAKAADGSAGIGIGVKIGAMSRLSQRFRAEKYANVVLAAFGTRETIGGHGPTAGAQFDQAAVGNAGITLDKALGHESVTLPFSRDNDRVKRFLAECPVTAGH
ncbi:MAG: hypothetical protein WBL23_07370 [Salinisphaera sp.]|uniref:hypothetical protein n=1 Tax=Salinisphaera sp. TaxID=1914330 RepID=UPI003C7B540D